MTIAVYARSWWNELRERDRDWALNVLWGVAIEAIVLITHAGGFSWLDAVKNAPFDRMMRSNATLATNDGLVPPLVFIDIDDGTWRSPAWGGGEPYRAPRDRLFQLIDHAFTHGARQVVLDVLVEGRNGSGSEGGDDAFALRLRELKQRPYFERGRQLVLVRSIRRGLEPGAPDELRTSMLDPLVAESGDSIVVAAPYFRYSPDRILRDWQLLEVACVAKLDDTPAHWAVIPAVQLVVAARHAGVSLAPAPVLPSASTQPATTGCAEDAISGIAGSKPVARAEDSAKSVVLANGWERVRQSFAMAGVDLGAKMPPVDSLGNRIVFRLADPPKLDLAQVVSATEVLDGRATRHDLRDAIVVIGQSYAEAGDRHETPLGEMAGSLVILNGIDSMIRHQIIRAPSPWMTVPLSILLIVFVGYVYARWDSTLGPLLATAAATVVLFAGSYHLFKHGVWMDFELPMLGIQARKTFTSFANALPRRPGHSAPGEALDDR